MLLDLCGQIILEIDVVRAETDLSTVHVLRLYSFTALSLLADTTTRSCTQLL